MFFILTPKAKDLIYLLKINMKNIFLKINILLIILITPVLITSVTYLNYSPEDYCKGHDIALKLLQKEETKLGMSGKKYNSLRKSEQTELFLKNKQYLILGACYNLYQEEKIKCLNITGVSKWERFKTDLSSGEIFD
jgi:hypothetical protein